MILLLHNRRHANEYLLSSHFLDLDSWKPPSMSPYHTLYQKTIAKVTNDADFLQELESQHRPKRFMPGLVTMVVLGPLHTLELKQKHL